MLRSSTQWAKSHGDYLSLEYLWKWDEYSSLGNSFKAIEKNAEYRGQQEVLALVVGKVVPKSAISHRCSIPYYPLTIPCVIPLIPSILKVYVRKLLILIKSSIACSCISHELLMYPIEDNCFER